jgi:hypothetical protein
LGAGKDEIMKTSTSLFAAFAFTLLSAGTGLAGSPDNPGVVGDVIGEAKAAFQEAAGNKNAWGQFVKENNATGGPPLGQQIQDVKGAFGGAPNPANDHGKGND